MTITRRLPLAASLLCAAIVLGAADRAPFTFPRSTPEAQGISSAALLGFIDAAEKQPFSVGSFSRGSEANGIPPCSEASGPDQARVQLG